jgi:hypothetical protein
MLNGIVIVATGHPYYGRFAWNLGVSIKAVEKVPVAILYNGNALNHLSDDQLDIFDDILELDDNIPANTSSKLYAGQFSPFDKTLLLDADTLWLPERKPSELFEELKEVEFTAITEGNERDPAKNYFFWADVEEIKSIYKLKEDIYQWRTEVMYFSQEGRKVVNRALEICQNPQLTTIKQFGEAVPDELGINIAAAEVGIKPHAYKWQPSYWHLMHNNYIPPPSELYSKYYVMSFGSNAVSNTIKSYYGKLMQGYCYKLQRQNVFPMESKRLFLKERKIM